MAMNEARPAGAAETINPSLRVRQWPFRAAFEGEFAGFGRGMVCTRTRLWPPLNERKGIPMLKQPEPFLPVTTESGFQALVSTGFHGNFSVQDVATGELFFNPLAMGQSFFRVTPRDASMATPRLEPVEDLEFTKKLIEAKFAFVCRYVDC
jgi:hypothetical protein